MTKSMLITGASAGIGAATARLAAAAGWDVGVGYHSDLEGATQTVTDVAGMGRKAVAIRADVGDPAQIKAMFETFKSTLGPMSAFVNNAGIVMPTSKFEDMSVERLEAIFKINQTGAFVAAQEAVKAMAFRCGGAGGAIVNISSIAAIKGGPRQYIDYAATKGAMDSLTIGLAQELSQEGVRVNAVRPGVILTEIHAKGGEPDRAEKLAPMVPMGRAGSARETAEAILWLASDAASYVTGTFIEVGGGRHI